MSLSPEQNEQIANMLKDGKANKDIIVHFKNSYNIDVPAWKITYIKNKSLSLPKGLPKTKVASKKKEVPADENVVKEIVAILGQIHSGYNQIFKHLRLELIKSRGQVLEMMKGAGIDTGLDI